MLKKVVVRLPADILGAPPPPGGGEDLTGRRNEDGSLSELSRVIVVIDVIDDKEWTLFSPIDTAEVG